MDAETKSRLVALVEGSEIEAAMIAALAGAGGKKAGKKKGEASSALLDLYKARSETAAALLLADMQETTACRITDMQETTARELAATMATAFPAGLSEVIKALKGIPAAKPEPRRSDTAVAKIFETAAKLVTPKGTIDVNDAEAVAAAVADGTISQELADIAKSMTSAVHEAHVAGGGIKAAIDRAVRGKGGAFKVEVGGPGDSSIESLLDSILGGGDDLPGAAGPTIGEMLSRAGIVLPNAPGRGRREGLFGELDEIFGGGRRTDEASIGSVIAGLGGILSGLKGGGGLFSDPGLGTKDVLKMFLGDAKLDVNDPRKFPPPPREDVELYALYEELKAKGEPILFTDFLDRIAEAKGLKPKPARAGAETAPAGG